MRQFVGLCVIAVLGCAPADRNAEADAPVATRGDSSASRAVGATAPDTFALPAALPDPIPRGFQWARSLDSLAPNPFPAPLSEWVARFDGVGDITAGLTVAAVTAQYGVRLASPQGPDQCDYLEIPVGPTSVSAMVLNGQIVRIDVLDARIATDRGVRVGDTEDDVRRAYGPLVNQQSHPYSGPEWHYLIVTPARDSTYRLIFETDGWRVLDYRVGFAEPVGYIEGCS